MFLHSMKRTPPVAGKKSEYWSRVLDRLDGRQGKKWLMQQWATRKLDCDYTAVPDALAKLSWIDRRWIDKKTGECSGNALRGDWRLVRAGKGYEAQRGKARVKIPSGTFTALPTNLEAKSPFEQVYDARTVCVGRFGRYLIAVDGTRERLVQVDTEIQ